MGVFYFSGSEPSPAGSGYEAFGPGAIGFEPIGIGKPLSVFIRHIYAGSHLTTWWGGSKSMLVTSSMKSIASFDAAPRAVNLFVEKAERNVRAVAAVDKGTPLVFYSPALLQESSVVTIELSLDGFAPETISALSSAFTGAAEIPLFAPASGYLLVAGIVTKLAGVAAQSLWAKRPVLRCTEELTFSLPGSEQGRARFALLMDDELGAGIRKEFVIDQEGRLVRISDRTPYDGDLPYVVLGFDGRRHDEYAAFSPTAASAAILERFLGIQEGNSQSSSVLVSALQLLNDQRFRTAASELEQRLSQVPRDSPDHEKLSSKHQALMNNIASKPGQ